MNLTCDIVMDLVGLYKDKLASEDSVIAIEEHLRECPSCRKYNKMYDSVEKSVSKNIKAEQYSVEPTAMDYTNVSKRLKKRHNTNIALMAAVAGVATTLTAINIVTMLYKKGHKGDE